MHPFLALMKNYCVDYTNSHDLNWIPKVMAPEYRVNISGHTLFRDKTYLPAVELVFKQAPGLGLTVHNMIFNGNRLAMHFSEHAHYPDLGNSAAWRCFAMYKWNEEQLLECWVEQDFLGKQEQLDTGLTQTIRSPAVDPWFTPITEESETALEAAREWLEKFDLSTVKYDIDNQSQDQNWVFPITPNTIEIDDIFSAGDQVPFHVTLSGPLSAEFCQNNEGLVADKAKEVFKLSLCGIISVSEGKVEKLEAVGDRMSIVAQLGRNNK